MCTFRKSMTGFLCALVLILGASSSLAETDDPSPADDVLLTGQGLEMFVMSYCPFARAAEAALIDRLAGGQTFDLEIHYIFYKNDQGHYTALHGEMEVLENLVQMMIRDFMPEHFLLYVRERAESDADWTELAGRTGLDSEQILFIQEVITQDRNDLIAEEYARVAGVYRIYDGSPAYVWNGSRLQTITEAPEFADLEFKYMTARCAPENAYDKHTGRRKLDVQQNQEMASRGADEPVPTAPQKPEIVPYTMLSREIKRDLLKDREPNPEKFRGLRIGDKLVLHRQRKIGRAVVEKDIILYHFRYEDRKLLKHKRKWRQDLPAVLPEIISKEEAIAKVAGATRARLLYISPQSEIFKFDPLPENPCWVVHSEIDGMVDLVVLDAVTGEFVGLGIAPPARAYSMTGPTVENPCSGDWNDHANNAQNWFTTFGYTPVDRVTRPTKANVQAHVQSAEVALFYELAHGGSGYFSNGCASGTTYENTYATNVESWITTYNKMPFAFIGSCGGLCSTGEDTWAAEFTKGSTTNTAVVGYCHMDSADCEDNCWGDAISWQTRLFSEMDSGKTVKQAFDLANAAHPQCVGYAIGDCMRFHGDTTFRVKPTLVKREPDCGDTIRDDVVLSRNLNCSGNGLIVGINNIMIDCQGHYLTGSNVGTGILNNGHNNVTIRNCRIRDFDTGIHLYATADNNVLEYNHVLSNDEHGIHLDDSYNVDLTGNEVNENGQNGLYLYDSRYADVVNNDFESNGHHGVQIKPDDSGTSASGSTNHFTDNYFYNNGWSGVGVDTNNNDFTSDRAIDNASYGFHLVNVDGNSLLDVNADNNDTGIYLTGCTSTTISESTSNNNDNYGIYLFNGTSETTITDHDSMNNKYGVRISGCSNSTVTSTVTNNTDLNNNSDYGFYVYNSTGTTLERSEIRHTKEAESPSQLLDIGVYVNGSPGTVIDRNSITNNERGIYIYNSAGSQVSDNTIGVNSERGIHLYSTTTTTVSGNGISYNDIGAYVQAGNMNTLTGNSIDLSTHEGIYVDNADNITMTSNAMMGNNRGVYVTDADGTIICLNDFDDTGTDDMVLNNATASSVTENDMDDTGSSAIEIYGGSDNTIEDNQITNANHYGIYMNAAPDNLISGNTIVGCGSYGVYAISHSNDNEFRNNTFSLNNRGIFNSGSTGNAYYDNTVCSSTYQDFYMSDPGIATGNNNLCDSVWQYADNGQPSGCDSECSGCRRLEDNMIVTADTTICPDTYHITDHSPIGVVQIGAHGVMVDGSGSTLIGPSSDSGWAIKNDSYNDVMVKNFTIRNYFIGIATQYGSNCTVRDNRISDTAVGIYFWDADDGQILHNISTHADQGGVMLTQGATGNLIEFNTLADNLAAGLVCAYGSEGRAVNNILWNNTPKQVRLGTGTPSSSLHISFCDVQGGLNGVDVQANSSLDWGYGNIDVDPLFAGSKDYHLQSKAGRWNPATSNWVTDAVTSRAVDAGNPGREVSEEPLHRENRRVNMGAYGETDEASKTPMGWSLLMDVTNDGIVNIQDMCAVSDDWLTESTGMPAGWEMPADFKRDRHVELYDIGMMCDGWLMETSWQ